MNKLVPNDKALIEKYLSGDKSSLATLVRRWHKVFCEKAYWIVNDKSLAKDIAQESWVRIINNLPKLRDKGKFRSWALKIVYTKAIDAHKNHLRELKVTHIGPLFDPPSVINSDDNSEIKKNLYNAIKELPKSQQDILRLFYMESYSINEISAFLNLPLGTVKSRLFNAREKLKSKIK